MKEIILLIMVLLPSAASAGDWDSMKWDQDRWDSGESALTMTVAGFPGNSTGTVTGGNSISCSIAANGAASGTCTEQANNGTPFTLTAAPAAGSYVVWSGCPASVGNLCYVTLNNNVTVSVSFTLYSFTITTSPGPNGSISCNHMTVTYNDSSDCTITPETGYYVSDVQVGQTGGALSSVGAVTSCTISHVTSDMTISSTFAGYPIKVTGISNGFYLGIPDAHTAAASGDIIMMAATEFDGDVTFNLDKQVTLAGGYDSSFSSQTGDTTIKGTVAISNGTVLVDKLIIM